VNAQFVIKDADGVDRHYEVTPHNAVQGQAIMWDLVALGAEPMARLASSALKSEEVVAALASTLAEKGGAAKLLDGGVVELLGDIDIGAVGADLKRAIMSMPMAKLTREILRHTTREGRPLSDDTAFGLAYQANYGELLRAVWEVAKINRFLSLPGI
jgi:hypothetical protein